ncbi:MAG TPA: quinone oxidoreductase [Blastocatellia bacterium]|nr:quinone oxidoreductase [Blastocatellia bacterium]
MKAIRFHEIGGPEVLRYEEVERPAPGAGEALVKVNSVGVNFADTLLRRGQYIVQPALPAIPGAEAAGTVEEVGEGADKNLLGRRVAFLGQQCYAEYTRVPARQLIPLPDSVSLEDGAAFPLQALTAYHMLYTTDHVQEGKSVLVHAAAGGVGLLAIQMAKQAGATVYGTTSGEEKARLAREMGADDVILYNKSDFAEEVNRLTGGRGVDLVLDSVGKATFEGSLRALAPFGHLISYGIASGQPDPIDVGRLYEKSLKVSAFWLMTAARVPEVARRGVERVVEWVASGKLKLTIGLRLPLAEAAEAHRKMEGRETVGKIILTVQ